MTDSKKNPKAESYNGIEFFNENPNEGQFVTRFDMDLKRTIRDEEIVTVEAKSFKSNWTVNKSLLNESIDIPIRLVAFRTVWNPQSTWHPLNDETYGPETKERKWGCWFRGINNMPNYSECPIGTPVFKDNFFIVEDAVVRFEKDTAISQEFFYNNIIDGVNALFNKEMYSKLIIGSIQQEGQYPNMQRGAYYRLYRWNPNTFEAGVNDVNENFTQYKVFNVVNLNTRIGMTMFRSIYVKHRASNATFEGPDYPSEADGTFAQVINVFFMVDMINKIPFTSYIIPTSDAGSNGNRYCGYIETDHKRVNFANLIGIPPDILIPVSALSIIRRFEMSTAWQNVLISANLNENYDDNMYHEYFNYKFMELSSDLPHDGFPGTQNPTKPMKQITAAQFTSRSDYPGFESNPSSDHNYIDFNTFFGRKLWTIIEKNADFIKDNITYEPFVFYTACIFTDEIDGTSRPLKRFEYCYFGSEDHSFDIWPYCINESPYIDNNWWIGTPLTPFAKCDFEPYGYEMARYRVSNYNDAFYAIAQPNVYGLDDFLYIEVEDEIENYVNYVNGKPSNLLCTLKTVYESNFQLTVLAMNDVVLQLMLYSEGIAAYKTEWGNFSGGGPSSISTDFYLLFPEGSVYLDDSTKQLGAVTLGDISVPVSLRSFSGGRTNVSFRIKNMFGFTPTFKTLNDRPAYNLIHFVVNIDVVTKTAPVKPIYKPIRNVDLGFGGKMLKQLKNKPMKRTKRK